MSGAEIYSWRSMTFFSLLRGLLGLVNSSSLWFINHTSVVQCFPLTQLHLTLPEVLCTCKSFSLTVRSKAANYPCEKPSHPMLHTELFYFSQAGGGDSEK